MNYYSTCVPCWIVIFHCGLGATGVRTGAGFVCIRCFATFNANNANDDLCL